MSQRYEPGEVEPRWQRFWDEHGTFRATELPGRPKFYALDMFPYPSAAGLHVGHPEGYTATDIISRFKRMNGYNVLHPMGWDAFGLPAEQYAIQNGVHPAPVTRSNIENFRRQLKMLGFAYDWSRELATIDEDYYRWTQWIFLQLFKRGLAYEAEMPVNWCPALGTVLANEEVIDGKSERGNHPVIRVPMKQWVLRITAYADRLLEDLETLDWPESLKEMQRNWIGRSEGAEITFKVQDHEELSFQVFTTRPDTLFGATYAVLAPEHPLVDQITSHAQRGPVAHYREAAARKSDLERTELAKEKTGVWTGAYAINPANGQAVPVWIGDYVLATYGTGAIMSVPGHDERDWAFARKFGLPIVEVVKGGNIDQAAYTDDGAHVNSGFLDGLNVTDAKSKMNDWLEAQGLGRRKITYRLRDWLFSRQRYWGEPIPILHLEDGTMKAIPESELPLLLPHVEQVKPSGTGESPLANVTQWVETIDPETGKKARRETNTMPQWAGSCWYYLRFIDPHNEKELISKEKEQYWMPVDLYVGGAEHAVLHLLYARFWHKVLYDIGVVSTKEPFQKLVNQGMILGEMEITGYQRADGSWVSATAVTSAVSAGGENQLVHKESGEVVKAVRLPVDQAEKSGDGFVVKGQPEIRLEARAHKMSKSRGNVVNPDHVVKEYGADTLRTYLMFMGPLEKEKPWDTNGVEGVFRFMLRVWRLIDTWLDGSGDEDPDNLQRLRHQTIKKVTQDIEGLKFNTAIPQLMLYVNELYKAKRARREDLETLVLLLSPFAPHLTEEAWSRLGNKPSVVEQDWPKYVEELTKEDVVTLAVQVNGKLRGDVQAPADIDQASAISKAREHENVKRYLEAGQVVKEIYVKGKLVSFVVK